MPGHVSNQKSAMTDFSEEGRGNRPSFQKTKRGSVGSAKTRSSFDDVIIGTHTNTHKKEGRGWEEPDSATATANAL